MSKGKHLSEEELEYIKVNRLIKNPAQIAKDLGRNYYTIFKICKSNGVSTAHKFTTQEDMFIRKAYTDGYSAKFIAAKLKVDVYTIYNRARKLGIKKGGRK